ncbi:MAG: hypothetical protein GIW99_07650 [Candidatus Eremiobacteraeota bacterium]|nr:hypothetical protein [Candidatus Eremiobacteraeota bacterium]MBC5827536.1 hypothetical protein [Candidatus Eremiobacteraeota bacterium]
MNFYRFALACAVALGLTASAALAMPTDMGHDMMMGSAMHGRFGGPVYNGPPALTVTASLVAAGLGVSNMRLHAMMADHDKMMGHGNMMMRDKMKMQRGMSHPMFSTARALTSMVGAKLVSAEVTKLTNQYGSDGVNTWLKAFDFAMNDAGNIAARKGYKLPMGNLAGKELAATLVKAGTAPGGAFQIEYLLDKAVSHQMHVQIMNDIDAKLGKKADYDYHRISNQAFYDVAQALGMTTVKLASFH